METKRKLWPQFNRWWKIHQTCRDRQPNKYCAECVCVTRPGPSNQGVMGTSAHTNHVCVQGSVGTCSTRPGWQDWTFSIGRGRERPRGPPKRPLTHPLHPHPRAMPRRKSKSVAFFDFFVYSYINKKKICRVNIMIWFFLRQLKGVILPKITTHNRVFDSQVSSGTGTRNRRVSRIYRRYSYLYGIRVNSSY